MDWNLRRLLQRVAVRLQLHLDIAARRLRVGANGVRFGDERLGLRLVDAVQLGVQCHIQENPAFVLVEVHGRGHLDVIGIQGDFLKARSRLNRGLTWDYWGAAEPKLSVLHGKIEEANCR